jgi:hypothetical protein
MINCYLSHAGYYIVAASGLEVAGETPFSFKEDGSRIYDDLQHTYLVLAAALANVSGVKDTIFIYNNSRLIDDMNGLPTLGEWYDKVRGVIKRILIPETGGIVLFKKSDANTLDAHIKAGFKALGLDSNTTRNLAESNNLRHRNAMSTKAKRLKDRWTNGKE